MRSTFDLPDDLMKQAKIAAVERGVALRDLVAEGLRHVLAQPPATKRRSKLPSIRISEDAPVLRMSVADLKDLEADEEAEHLHAVYRRR